MEDWQIFLSIVAGLIVLFFILSRFKKKKDKNWLIFEREQGTDGNTKKTYFALNKITGERRPVYFNETRK